jgi:long-chain acyl-CoA synthetase
MNIGGLLGGHARQKPDEIAFVFKDQRVSWGELRRLVDALVGGLVALGLKKGDKIVTLLGNCPALYELYFACAQSGLVIVPLSPLLSAKALTTLAGGADAALLIGDQATAGIIAEAATELGSLKLFVGENPPAGFVGCESLLENPQSPPVIELFPDDHFDIVFSSGTTGDPKGIIHTHFIRAMYAALFAQAWRMTPESVVLHTGSIIFNGAFVTIMPAWLCGARYVLEPAFDPERFIEVVEREKVTHVMMVPTQIIALLDHPACRAAKLESLEMILSLGAPLHLEHKERLEALLPERFYELYGLTEGFITVLDKKDAKRKAGSVGVPGAFSEMRIVDEDGRDLPPGEVGEIVGRGPLLMPGYYKRPDLTATAIREGWLFTGDMGRVDEDGFLYLVDRKKDMIISGGVNVFPKDIEEVIARHPDVGQCAVFGVEDPKWGETPVAAVVLKPGTKASAEELRDWINSHVEARFQKVSRVILRDSFPLSVAGKILKRSLREEYNSVRN